MSCHENFKRTRALYSQKYTNSSTFSSDDFQDRIQGPKSNQLSNENPRSTYIYIYSTLQRVTNTRRLLGAIEAIIPYNERATWKKKPIFIRLQRVSIYRSARLNPIPNPWEYVHAPVPKIQSFKKCFSPRARLLRLSPFLKNSLTCYL